MANGTCYLGCCTILQLINEVDGSFILTGSATPSDNKSIHSVTGQNCPDALAAYELFESNESNGKVSLKDLFAGITDIGAKRTLTHEQIAHAVCRGGWPAAVISETVPQIAMNYVDAVINLDVQTCRCVEKDPERVRLLLNHCSHYFYTGQTSQNNNG
jgi:hypothetical protein